MDKVWHYAPWAYLPAIVKSGGLRGSNAGVEGQAPMLWFSSNQNWEPTATKLCGDALGSVVKMTFAQQVKVFGAVRFGLPARDVRLLDWKTACSFAGTPRETRRELERVGKKQGADSRQWFATPVQIPLSELHFQVWMEGWADTKGPSDMADVWVNQKMATE